MNNEETLQTNNERIEENNVSLANVLETINNLPTSSGGGSNVYSTEETVVGTWMGKPLYRKVAYVPSMPNTASTTNIYDYSSEITDVEDIWLDESASFITRENETLGLNWYFSTTEFIRTYVMKGSKVVRCKNSASLGLFSAYVSLLYTKTTD